MKWLLGATGVIFLGLILVFVAIMSFFESFSGTFDFKFGFRSGEPTDIAYNEIPAEYMPIFKQAQDTYGVSWAILAAIASEESGFGRSEVYIREKGISEAGAVGFMQFMPKTWSGENNPAASNDPNNPRWDINPETIKKYNGYGVDGNRDGRADPYDPYDAIPAAAAMLKRNNVETDPQNALYVYNHASWYVSAILKKAESYAICTVPIGDGTWPLENKYSAITGEFGEHREDHDHEGIDIACPENVPVFAVMDGKVTYANWMAGYGFCVFLQHGNGTETVYAHLNAPVVKIGHIVCRGQQIGKAGNTGKSKGPHLHFEVRNNNRPVNPMQWLKVPSKNY